MSLRSRLAVAIWLLAAALLLLDLRLGLLNGAADPSDALFALALMGFAMMGALIVVRRPGNVIGWIFCVDVLLLATASLSKAALQYTLVTRPGTLPGAEWLAWISVWIGDSGFVLFFTFTFLLFPTGRLPSRRWRPLAWAIASLIAFHTFVAMFKPGHLGDWTAINNPLAHPLPPALIALDNVRRYVIAFLMMACVASLIVRYRAAGGEERQQIKWIAFVAAALVVVVALGLLADVLGQAAAVNVFFNYLVPLVLTAFAFAVGISILRHRLLDIDILIRRTLVYGALTVALALVYALSTVVLQQLFRSLTRRDSQLVIVLSTLAIAAAFTPLRRRIQAGIDRRFYRRKVDAARTLAAFSTAARDEVDLDQLTQALLDSVGATFEPAHLSLWLPGSARLGGANPPAPAR